MVVRPLTPPCCRGVAFFTLDEEEIIERRRCALSLEKGVSVRAAEDMVVVHDDEAIFCIVVVVVDCVCGGLCESAVSLQMVKVFDKSDVDVQGGSRVVDMTNFQGL